MTEKKDFKFNILTAVPETEDEAKHFKLFLLKSGLEIMEVREGSVLDENNNEVCGLWVWDCSGTEKMYSIFKKLTNNHEILSEGKKTLMW